MICYIKGTAKTSADAIFIDYIEAEKGGKLFVLDWDETELGFDTECDSHGYKKFSGRLKGIKFNDECANKRINEIKNARLSGIQFYIPDTSLSGNNIKLSIVQLDDDGKIYNFPTENSYTVDVTDR